MALSKHCRHGRKQWGRCGCTWYWDGYIDGRRKYENLHTPNRDEARRLAARWEADRLGGAVKHARKGATVGEVADRWIEHVASLGRKPQTVRAYRTAANAVIAFYGETADVRRIDRAAVLRFERDAWAKRTGEGPRSVIAGLRGILKQAKREGLIDHVPEGEDEVRVVPPNPNVRMTDAETEATIRELRKHWKHLGDFVVLTGLRIGECLALRWDDIDFERGIISVRANAEQWGNARATTKTAKSTRTFRPDPAALEAVKQITRRDERIWPFRYQSARNAIAGAMKRAGTYKPRRGWHSLRHTNTAMRGRAGQSMRDAAAELGHGSHFAQTAAYGWADESAEPTILSGLRHGTDRQSKT